VGAFQGMDHFLGNYDAMCNLSSFDEASLLQGYEIR